MELNDATKLKNKTHRLIWPLPYSPPYHSPREELKSEYIPSSSRPPAPSPKGKIQTDPRQIRKEVNEIPPTLCLDK